MLEVVSKTANRVDKKLVTETAKIVLRGEKLSPSEISIVLVSLLEIQRLNKLYRAQDKPTDVLSFANLGFFKEEKKIGEVVICPQQVKENAQQAGVRFQEELKRVIIHGILHLVGYEHEKTAREADRMKNKEDYYLKKLWPPPRRKWRDGGPTDKT